mmetsp:Transcript_22565/g.31823  ORF Transcript_22565/g.31823 Transcript_22565/m.31823 type:complete len:389 (+) Transcript_22565:159-1325(+)
MNDDMKIVEVTSVWDWGVIFSVIASVIGGASKLAIRKSWLMVRDNPSKTCDERKSKPKHCITVCKGENAAGTSNLSNGEDQFIPCRIDSYPNTQAGECKYIQKSNELCDEIERMALCLRLLGMFGMSVLNPIFCVLAMNYASPSILAPFSALTLVWIVMFSEMLIGEKPKESQLKAALFIVLGQVIVATFGDHKDNGWTSIEEIKKSYQNLSFLFYLVAVFIFLLGSIYVMRTRSSGVLCRVAWGMSGGIVTGFQNFLKDALTIEKISNNGSFENPPMVFYVCIFFAIISSFGGLLLLTACMKRYDATFSCAMFVGSFIISASIMSTVHYHTFQHLESVWSFIFYPLGLCLLMYGISFLARDYANKDYKESHDHKEDNIRSEETKLLK